MRKGSWQETKEEPGEVEPQVGSLSRGERTWNKALGRKPSLLLLL